MLLTACGDTQDKVYNLGVYAEDYNVPDRITGLKDGLKALGYVEGKNLNIQILDVSNLPAEQHATALKDFVAKTNFDAYFTLDTLRAQSLKPLVGNKPIIGGGLDEPVLADLVQSDAQPGTNITGVDDTINQIVLNDLGWMLKINPTIHQVYLLYNPQTPSQKGFLEPIRAEATRLNVQLVEKAESPQNLIPIVTQLNTTEAQAILILDWSVPYVATKQLKAAVSSNKFLMNGIEPSNYDVGSAFIYDANNYNIGHQSAAYVDKILHGASPSQLPLLKPEKYQLHLNQKVADQLGFQFPPAVLAAADEVIK
jgi:putative ABC transport system substrate-binding protein